MFIFSKLAANGWCHYHFQIFIGSTSITMIMSWENSLDSYKRKNNRLVKSIICNIVYYMYLPLNLFSLSLLKHVGIKMINVGFCASVLNSWILANRKTWPAHYTPPLTFMTFFFWQRYNGPITPDGFPEKDFTLFTYILFSVSGHMDIGNHKYVGCPKQSNWRVWKSHWEIQWMWKS